jgi:hypothetical protein
VCTGRYAEALLHALTLVSCAPAGMPWDNRPVAGRSSYDLSFVDMENEWERITEYAVPDGARLL